MGLDITLNTTDYTVKRGTTTIGNIKKLADGSVVFVSGIQITYTAAEMDQITAFMKTL
jgi:hypothetical protein